MKFQTTILQKIKTRIYVQSFFFFRADYEKMWKNKVEPNGPKMTIKYGTCALRAG
jgi:hypothetical protein